MNHYEPSKKIVSAATVFLFLSLVIFTFFWFLLFSKLALIGQSIHDTRNASDSLEQVFAIKASLNEIKEDVGLVESFFMAPGGEVAFIEKIEKVAQNYGVGAEVDNVTVAQESPVNFADLLKVEIVCEGSLSSVSSFARALESMPYPVSIDSAQVYSSGDKWAGKIILSVYRSKN